MGIDLKVHFTRNAAGTLTNLSVEGIPPDWTDATFQNEIEFDIETGGVWAALAWMLAEVPCLVDMSDRRTGHRVYLDNA